MKSNKENIISEFNSGEESKMVFQKGKKMEHRVLSSAYSSSQNLVNELRSNGSKSQDPKVKINGQAMMFNPSSEYFGSTTANDRDINIKHKSYSISPLKASQTKANLQEVLNKHLGKLISQDTKLQSCHSLGNLFQQKNYLSKQPSVVALTANNTQRRQSTKPMQQKSNKNIIINLTKQQEVGSTRAKQHKDLISMFMTNQSHSFCKKSKSVENLGKKGKKSEIIMQLMQKLSQGSKGNSTNSKLNLTT